MIFITYYFGDTCGIAGKRSAYLYNLLKDKSDIRIVDKDTFGDECISKMSWLIKTLKLLFKAENEKVYISCGPFWHLPMVTLACWLKNHKLYVDFRDGWSINIRTGYGRKPGKLSLIKSYIALLFERLAYAVSERFIVCSKGAVKEYVAIFGDDKKMLLIRNGHELDVDAIKYYCSHSRRYDVVYKIACAGKFIHDMPNGKQKILSLCKRLDLEKKEYVIYFIGTDKDTEKELSGIKNIVFKERMPYDDVMRFIADADMVLTAIRNEDFDYGTKIFDYIALGLPVYDWFDHDKDFYKTFKEFLTDDLSAGKRYPCDYEGKYSRKEAFRPLIDIMLSD